MTTEFTIKTAQDFNSFLTYVNGKLTNYIVKNLDFEAFDVVFDKHKEKKSYPQLQGFYRIARNLIPYFRDWTQEYWDEEKVKEFFKKRYGYVTTFKGVTLCKSFKDASKEDMYKVIQEMQKFGDEMDLPKEVTELRSEEKRALEEYYKIKEEK